jgi:ATP-dependent protease ClpP protease subunit
MPMFAPSTLPAHAAPTGKWRLARALGVAFTLAVSLAAQGATAGAMEQRTELKVSTPNHRPGTIVMSWNGPIAAPMANQIRDAFENRKQQGTRILLRVASYGGSVAEGERVIDVLRQIKSTHVLETTVTQGDVCASMCVFIYLQGQKRYGALTSSWLFHEVSHMDPVSKQPTRLDRPAWERLVDKYFAPAGVSESWIADLKPRTVGSDYWQTGSDLIRSNSGIIHEALANQTTRILAPSSRPKEAASAEPKPAAEPKATAPTCRKYFPGIDAVVTVPCP